MLRFILLISAVLVCNVINAQVIYTIAGNGVAGFGGDNAGVATCMLDHPFSVAANSAGDVFIADRLNHRIRKIDVSGIVTTIAGNGSAGYNGDNIAATGAQLNDPNGIALDAAGSVYVADRQNNRVRRIDTSGLITTVAGTGTNGFGGDGAAATAAMLNNPRGVAVDRDGIIFIADQGNQRVRKIGATGIIYTIAGTGAGGYNGDNIAATAAQLHNPYSVATDTTGNLYIADVDNERIRKITPAGIIVTIAGTGASGFGGDNGPATGAMLSEPIGIAADNAGNVFIADDYNSRIRQVDAGGTIHTIAGNGTSGYNGDGIAATDAELSNATGIAVSADGHLLIADYNNNRVRKMDEPTAVVTTAGNSFRIFPNPSAGVINCYMPSTTDEPLNIVISDLCGNTVMVAAGLTNHPVAIVVTVPGMYIIKLATARQNYYSKVSVLP